MIKLHYALQTYDISSSQSTPRYCADTKKEVTQKCVVSFFESVLYLAKLKPETEHHIMIFDDGSSDETILLLEKIVSLYNQQENINVTLTCNKNTGIMNSIRTCWQWLEDNGVDLVYQVQDDYLYEQTAIYEMVDMFMQVHIDTKSHPLVVPYNNPSFWGDPTVYKYRATPRTIILGKKRYWIQIYEIPCTFMTSKEQFSKHWDLYNLFLSLSPTSEILESISLNYILTKKGVLAVNPITSIALHMQADYNKDPYIDWKSWWDSVKKI